MTSSTTPGTGKRFVIAAGTVLAVLGVAMGVAAQSGDTAGQAAWHKGLNARSEALNQQYGLGNHAHGVVRVQVGWQQGLKLRSEALNREIGLGDHAVRTLSVKRIGWQQGLQLRSEALNRAHGLGNHVIDTLPSTGSDREQALDLRSEALNRHRLLGTYVPATPLRTPCRGPPLGEDGGPRCAFSKRRAARPWMLGRILNAANLRAWRRRG
jgi:hypothetical protein